MKLAKKLISVGLVAAMTVGMLTGCGGSGGGKGKNGTITLTVFSQLANYSGIQTGWSADVLKEKFNVEINIVPDMNGMLQTRMEAGDLGDIVVFGSDGANYTDAINAGLLYDWNEDDLLAEYGPYIKENLADALAKNATISPDGTVYGFGHNVATSSDDHESFFYTWDIRWDLYEQLGHPQVKTLEDMVDLFKQMKEICPTDDNGNPTYAVSPWPDWDGDMVMYVKSTATAYYGYDELGIGIYDSETGAYYDALMEDGPYLRALKFYNTLYREGLLDPDSMTQTYDKMSEKCQSGGIFFSIFNYSGSSLYNTQEHIANGGYMLSLVPEEGRPIAYGMSTQGSNRIWTIGAKTEYPELCMEIINYLATPEGRMTMEYGPQGETWDYDDNNEPYLTELGKKCLADIETPMDGTSHEGTFHDGQLQINNTTWSLDAVNPDGNNERYNYKFWKSEQGEPKNDVEKDWREFTGATSVEEYMEATNYNTTYSYAYVGSSRDDEFETKWSQTTECIKTGSWNAIYAKTEEEYQQVVDKMIADAHAYYYDECLEWSRQEAANRYAAEKAATGR